jgi:hypothetical protein
MPMIRTTVILLLGAIPATYICWLMAPLAILGGIVVTFSGSFSGALYGLMTIGFGVAAILGTLCLWFGAFYRPDLTMVKGLIAGVIAISPLAIGMMLQRPTLNLSFEHLSFVSPFIVAGYLITEFFVQKFKEKETTKQVASE